MKAAALLFLLFFSVVKSFPQHLVNLHKSSAGQGASRTPRRFVSKSGGFSIKFPGLPKKSVRVISGLDIPVKLRTYELHGIIDCAVAYADYPVPAANQSAAEQTLDNIAKNLFPKTGAEPMEVKNISLGNFSGRDLKGKIAGEKIMRMRIYLVGERMYQLVVMMPSEQSQEPKNFKTHTNEADKFLDSFKLLNKTFNRGVRSQISRQ